MVIPKESLTDLKEKYEKAYKLVEEESKNDSPLEPYKSHLKARDILVEIMENIKNLIHSEGDQENILTYKTILSFVYRDLGRINVFSEEVTVGEKYFQQCIELVEEYKCRPEIIIPYIGASNELGTIWSNREDFKKSKEYLDKAEENYKLFKESGKNALAVMDIFGTLEEIEVGKGPKELEKNYTLTTYYMAQVLGQLGELELSAKYCFQTLRRQLQQQDYESIDWALNAATLSQYYIGPNQFTEARHLLAASTLILAEYEAKNITADSLPEISEDARAALKENFNHRYADIARCWAKYGIALLSASKERLMSDDEGKISKDFKNLLTNKSENRFESLTLEEYETKITDHYCLTFDDAKLVFNFVTIWLDKAKEYYHSESEASEYGRIVIDYAEMYKLMAFFEENPSNQSKMHKKRADHLEDLLNILNPTYYLSLCTECYYEAAHAYAAMLDIKLDALSELKFDEKPTPRQLHKINSLCEKAIEHFKKFIQAYSEKETNKLKANLSIEEKQLILFAYFHIGRLFYKIVTPNKEMQVQNLQNSLKFYKLFVDSCEEEPESAKTLQAEIGVTREMVQLLPLKIKKVLDETFD